MAIMEGDKPLDQRDELRVADLVKYVHHIRQLMEWTRTYCAFVGFTLLGTGRKR